MSTITLSSSFLALFASSFFEAQRRQNRHLKISNKFQPPSGGSWQFSLPERLFGFSGLGLFEFDFFATSANGQLLFVDEHHPMVTHGRVGTPGPDAVISQLRTKFPNVPELHDSILSDADDTLIHGVCSIATVATNALFYYRCPNNAIPGAAVWTIIKRAIVTPPPSLPANLAVLEPPCSDFSYDTLIAAFDAARPVGQAARLNEFRINFMRMLTMEFHMGLSMKDMYVGFLTHNGYNVREAPHTGSQSTDAGEELVDVIAELVDGSTVTPGMTMTFDVHDRMRSVNMMITGDAYANDDYPL